MIYKKKYFVFYFYEPLKTRASKPWNMFFENESRKLRKKFNEFKILKI